MRDALQRQIGNQALACIGLLLKWSKLCAKSLTKPRHRMANGMVQRRADAESPN